MMDGINNLEFDFPRQDQTRSLTTIIAAILVALIFFILPIPQKLLDIAWICVFFLSGAVALICFAARSSSDLKGFIPLVSTLLFVRLMALTGTARHIIHDEPAGFLLGSVGTALTSIRPLAILWFCLFLALIALLTIFFSCRNITRAVNGYMRQVLPLKCMGIKTDLRLGVIDQNQARELALRVVSESRFFVGMYKIGWLMGTEAVICVLTLLGCLLIPASNKTIAELSGIDLILAIAPSVVALSVFTLIPISIVGTACGILMGKNTLTLRLDKKSSAAPGQARKIKVVALDTDNQDGGELLNPDFVHHRQDEQIAEFEPNHPNRSSESGPVLTDITCRNAKEYYEKLSRVICAVQEQPRVIIFASDKVHSLPVTVAVNIAIRLAQKKQKILLLDTDEKRNAVGNVFDLNVDSMRKKVQASSLENLSVGCVPAQKLDKFLQKDNIFKHFDTTLIYCPNIDSVTVRHRPEITRPGAFYFIENEQSEATETAAGQLDFCRWMCIIPSIQSVLAAKS